MEFSEHVRALIGQYNDNIPALKNDSTEMIFLTAFREPTWQISPTNINNLRKGCFYIIKYNYNGNKLWCPILILEYKVKNNKNIIYSINFNYLPYQYKILFIDRIFKTNRKIIETNRNIENVREEKNLEFDFEYLYKWLKNNGNKEYSLTAFDVLKIEDVYAVSTTIIDRFIFLDTTYINKRMMLNVLESLDKEAEKEEMQQKVDKYEELLEIYKQDVELFYRSLRNFESNLKLFE